MKRMFILFLFVMLAGLNSTVSAEQMRTLDRAGISITVPANWICETQDDGTEIFYDTDSYLVMTIYSEKADEFLFDCGFEMAVPYAESIFPGDNLWSNVGLIAQNGIYGCYAAGYFENVPSGVVYLEKDENRTVFSMTDVAGMQNPNHLLDTLLDLFQWMNDDGDIDFNSSEMLSFTVGEYEYSVPANWRHLENVDFGETYHTYNDGDVYFSVALNTREGASMESALQMLYKTFPGCRVEMLNGKTMGFLMDGECITGMKMIKACILNYPGYVEITYRHDVSPTQRVEFDQLLAGFKNVM